MTKKYDRNSKLIDETEYDGFGKIKYKVTWKRDANGKMIEKVIYNADGSIKEKGTFKYNKAGKETKRIWYKADSSINWGKEQKYMNDTLLTEINSFNTNEKKSKYSYKIEYNNENRRVKFNYELYDFKEVDEYFTYSYPNGQKTEIKHFKNQKLVDKKVYLKFDGQLKIIKGEEYDSIGNMVAHYESSYDKYGNEISYEKYKITTSFGEQKKIPVEKRHTEISYHDDTPDFTIKFDYQIKKNSQKKKEKYISYNIKRFGSKTPNIYFMQKPGVTGGKKVEIYKGSMQSFQAEMNKRFYLEAYIVESGNYIVLVKSPAKSGIWSLDNCHDFTY